MAYPNDERYSDSQRPAPRKRPELGTNRNRPGEGRPAAQPGATRPAAPQQGARPAARPAGAPQRPQAARPAGGPQATRPTGAARPAQSRPQQRPPQHPQPPRKRSVQPRFFIFLAILLVVLIGAGVAAFSMFGGGSDKQQSAGNSGVQTVSDPVADTPVDDGGATDDDSSATVNYDEIAAQLDSEEGVTALSDEQMIDVADLSINTNLSNEWMNVLLLGTDERESAAKGRTDTIMICSINTTTGQVKLTSIQRDLAVDFKSLGYDELGTYRINSANFFGGPEMAMKTVNELFGLNIENYVLVNFFAFQDVVNAIGGITLDITEAEMEKINVGQKQVAGIAYRDGMDISGWDNVDLEEYGENVHLNGQQALAYARIRKLDSDFGRSERQRKVLIALLNEVKGKSALEIAQLGATVMPYLTTNMSLDSIMTVAMTVLQSNMEIDTFRLPVNGSYTQETRNEQDMLYDCDFVQNEQELYSFIYN